MHQGYGRHLHSEVVPKTRGRPASRPCALAQPNPHDHEPAQSFARGLRVLAKRPAEPVVLADGVVDKIITASDKRRLAAFAGSRGRAIAEARSRGQRGRCGGTRSACWQANRLPLAAFDMRGTVAMPHPEARRPPAPDDLCLGQMPDQRRRRWLLPRQDLGLRARLGTLLSRQRNASRLYGRRSLCAGETLRVCVDADRDQIG